VLSILRNFRKALLLATSQRLVLLAVIITTTFLHWLFFYLFLLLTANLAAFPHEMADYEEAHSVSVVRG
jgi:hypothetical protein